MKSKISKRLLKYTSAAGASAFALASAVEAAPTNFTNLPGVLDVSDLLTNVDLDQDGNDDIRINIQPSGDGDRILAVKPFDASNTVIFTGSSGSYYLEPFALGDIIDGGLSTPGSPYGLLASNNSTSTFNNFDSGNDFIGFSFDRGGSTHYGWIQFNVTDTDPGNPGGLQVTSTNGQYESTPGAAIVIPEPSTYALGLGLLAAGAAGIRARRRMKKAKAES